MWSCVGPTNVAPASEISPPPRWWLYARPPMRLRASSTTTDLPWRWSLTAAVRPANPAPTIATSTDGRPRCRGRVSTPGPPASAAPATPAAAEPTSLRLVTFRSCAKEQEILPTAGTQGKRQPGGPPPRGGIGGHINPQTLTRLSSEGITPPQAGHAP